MKRLENALASLPDIKAEVHWRPFQLDPTIPPEGKERKAYMLAKFSDENRLKQVHANLVSLGAVEGISFDFDAITVAPEHARRPPPHPLGSGFGRRRAGQARAFAVQPLFRAGQEHR
jgi:predicted DsbA family dithiol-disulfide isomerase